MKRKIYARILDWKNTWHGRTALLIDGARRIGKSWIAEEFARNEYKSYIMIDFNNVDTSIIELFEQHLSDLDTFFTRLSLYTGVKLYKRESVIIFDEVQIYPQARAAIKYLVKDGRYDFIETGSLVSINHNVSNIVIPSEEIRVDMFPMDFQEFMWAIDKADLYDFSYDCFVNRSPLGNALHRKMSEYLRAYILIGGMPQVVEEYIRTGDFGNADMIKRNILTLYRNDISKYAGKTAPVVTQLFDHIPGLLQRHERRFSPSAIKRGSRTRNYSEAFFWLDESRVVNFCYAATEPAVSLALNLDDSRLKIYMGDTGLLISMTFEHQELITQKIYEKILRGKLEFNKGMIVENYVAQMLRASGHKLYFYTNASRDDSSARMEIDFLIRKKEITSRHNINAIEVKSTNRYSTVSLDKCLAKFKEYMHLGIVLHNSDLLFDKEKNILYLPLYMAGML